MSLNHPWLRLIGIELAFLAVGRFMGAVVSLGKTGWFDVLYKSVYAPKDWVFAVAWSLLYLILGYVAWRLWERRLRNHGLVRATRLFIIQLLMNWAWVPLFFAGHWLWLGFLWIVAMLPVVLASMVFLYKGGLRACAYLLIPYLLWLCFAAYLAGVMAFVN